MRIQRLTTHLARAAQKAMKRLHPGRSPRDEVAASTASQPYCDAEVVPDSRRKSAALESAYFTPDREQRIRAWRRRVLLKKGARLHAASLDRGDRCSLAMLDSRGIVVAWYDDSKDSSRIGRHVVDRHVSQFYVPLDLAANLPGLNLLSAAMYGGNTQRGWRRQPSGAIVWGTTVIEAILMKDGRLQGFTHVIRPAEGPRADAGSRMPRPTFRTSPNANCGIERNEMSSYYASAAA